MMGQLMGALNNTALLDDLNINIETLHGFDCDIDEVIKHELLINGTLDINFQQGSMGLGVSGAGGVPTSECAGAIEQLAETTHQAAGNVAGVASNAASAAAVYASTNAATPAASPSWVH